MCGIVGAVARREVKDILLEGLRRLEYRGYDSAGVALLEADGRVQTAKAVGKVQALEATLNATLQSNGGVTGIAHTRWATHGKPTETNAHPHTSDNVALVHNGIIENHAALRKELSDAGYTFVSGTDTEVVAHLISHCLKQVDSLRGAVEQAVKRLDGAYALAVLSPQHPGVIVGARSGSPLVLGVGIGENFLASDQLALRRVTDRFVFLEEGDLVEVSTKGYAICNAQGQAVERPVSKLTGGGESAGKGAYRHYMLKEIFEQKDVIKNTLQGRISDTCVLPEAFGAAANALFSKAENIHIVACGTSYHAGLTARYWLEDWVGLPCQVEVASEYRYRNAVVPGGTLFVSISQSGETADTLAALQISRQRNYLGSLTICNVPNSSLVRESDLALMTRAGPEIGVASTKAFTTQLVALQLFCLCLGRFNGLDEAREKELVEALRRLPNLCESALQMNREIEQVFECFADKSHALFLGRGINYPIALEGALKLKEISYIHAEAYPSGELKHGPLALVDADMPVVAVAPNNELLEKLKSNLHEVEARGGQLFVFADRDAGFENQPGLTVLNLPHVPASLEPIIYTLPLQLLSYHVAVIRGTDVDQPRNLAKSVTVE